MSKELVWGFTNRPTNKEQVCGCVGKGWHSLVSKLIDDLIAAGWDGCVFQVKEKFGGLRFYIGSGNEIIWELISQAEKDSFHICEDCGEPGKLRTDGWWKTLCDIHGKDRPTENSIF